MQNGARIRPTGLVVYVWGLDGEYPSSPTAGGLFSGGGWRRVSVLSRAISQSIRRRQRRHRHIAFIGGEQFTPQESFGATSRFRSTDAIGRKQISRHTGSTSKQIRTLGGRDSATVRTTDDGAGETVRRPAEGAVEERMSHAGLRSLLAGCVLPVCDLVSTFHPGMNVGTCPCPCLRLHGWRTPVVHGFPTQI